MYGRYHRKHDAPCLCCISKRSIQCYTRIWMVHFSPIWVIRHSDQPLYLMPATCQTYLRCRLTLGILSLWVTASVRSNILWQEWTFPPILCKFIPVPDCMHGVSIPTVNLWWQQGHCVSTTHSTGYVWFWWATASRLGQLANPLAADERMRLDERRE